MTVGGDEERWPRATSHRSRAENPRTPQRSRPIGGSPGAEATIALPIDAPAYPLDSVLSYCRTTGDRGLQIEAEFAFLSRIEV